MNQKKKVKAGEDKEVKLLGCQTRGDEEMGGKNRWIVRE